MATAIASSHMRMRPQWPMFTMSDSAPMVQKLVRGGDQAEDEGQREAAADDQDAEVGAR